MKPIIVVGGGIGGLSAALALHQAGLPVRVFERTAELREVGAGLGVWMNAMRVLDRLGVGARVRELARPLQIAEFASSTGRVISRTSIQEAVGDPHAANFILHRADLHRVLLEALPLGTLQLDAPCESVEQDNEGVTLKLSGGRRVWGSLCIGADGLHSVVRRQLFGPEPLRYSGQTCYRGISPIAPPDPQLIREIQGPGLRAAICPMDDHRVYWWAAINAPQGEQEAEEQRRDRLLTTFADWPFSLPEVIGASEGRILRNDLVDRSPRSQWGRGRVSLLGDAAHPMLPNLGQGACSAIEDAQVLARCLLQGGVSATALRRYEAERAPRANDFVRKSWAFGIPVRWRRPGAVWLREALMGALPKAALHRQIRDQTDFDVGPLRPE